LKWFINILNNFVDNISITILKEVEMEKKQIINCTVHSCEYNNQRTEKCELEDIIVRPCKNCNTGNAEEESMCASYRSNYESKNNF